MRISTSLLAALAIYAVQGVEWHTIDVTVPAGSQITAFSGNMIVPPIHEAGTLYVWPGLQPNDNSGVFQTVLDGAKGSWWMGSGWVGSGAQYPWGNAYTVYDGQSVNFNYVQNANDWSVTVTDNLNNPVTNNYAGIQNTAFTHAIFAIELYSFSWDFGQLAFDNVEIVASGTTDQSWCTNQPSVQNTSHISYYNARASVANNAVTCQIQSIILENNS